MQQATFLYPIQPLPHGRSLTCAAPWRSRSGRVSPGAAQPRSLVKPHPRPGHAGTQARILPQTSRYASALVIPVRRGKPVTDGRRGVTVPEGIAAHGRMDVLHRASRSFRFNALRRKEHLSGLKARAFPLALRAEPRKEFCESYLPRFGLLIVAA